MLKRFYTTKFKFLSAVDKIPSTEKVEQNHLYDEKWELTEDHSIFDEDNWKVQPCKNSVLMVSKHTRLYGRYDIKTTSPSGWGSWLSLKMWGLSQNEFTKIGFITIVKGNRANVHCSVEYKENKHKRKYDSPIKNILQLKNQPYIYTIDWNSEFITWYINDVIIAKTRVHTPPTALHTLIGTRIKNSKTEKFDIEYLRVFEQK